MAFDPTVLSMGVSAISSIGAYQVANIQSDMNSASKAYKNTMAQIASAQKVNEQTLQGAQLSDRARRLEATLQQASITDMAASEVNAAAAGVAGGSVDAALLGLRRSALNAQNARMRNLNSSLFAVTKAKQNIRLATILGEDISVIARPSASASLLGLGATLIDTFDKNQPDGSQAKDGRRLW